MLSARVDLGALPAAVLLKRPPLAGQLQEAGITYEPMDNTFRAIADSARTQALPTAFPSRVRTV